MKPLIFIICGKARTGKDTIGGIIIDYLKEKNNKAVKMSYAKYLKMYAIDYFDWDGSDDTKPRDLLQQLGTEIIRFKMNKPTFLIDRVVEDIEILSNYFDSFVICDAREEKEITIMKEKFNNVFSIKVNREVDILSDKQKKHYTEIALNNYKDYDYIIDNNGSLEELKDKVYSILKRII